MHYILDGFLGSLTFGIWWGYRSQQQINEHNKKILEMRKQYLIKYQLKPTTF